MKKNLLFIWMLTMVLLVGVVNASEILYDFDGTVEGFTHTGLGTLTSIDGYLNCADTGTGWCYGSKTFTSQNDDEIIFVINQSTDAVITGVQFFEGSNHISTFWVYDDNPTDVRLWTTGNDIDNPAQLIDVDGDESVNFADWQEFTFVFDNINNDLSISYDGTNFTTNHVVNYAFSSIDTIKVMGVGNGGTGNAMFESIYINPIAETSGSPSFDITAKNYLNDNAITTFWALVDGTNYTTTNGTINTALFQNNTNTFNIQVGATDYFSETYNSIAVSSNYEAVLHQTEISFKAIEFITNNATRVKANFTIGENTKPNTGGTTQPFYLNEGEYTVLVTPSTSQFYPLNFTFNTTALDNLTINVTGLYDSQVTINLKDVLTEEIIVKNSTVILSNDEYSFNQTYTNTNGTININLTQLEYNITYFADDYATTNTSITVDNTTNTFNYTLYANNSVWITAENVDTGVSLTGFSVEIYDLNNSYIVNDTSGTARLNDIPSGDYTVLVTKTGYNAQQYLLTMTGGSHQTLIAYLTTDGATTVDFTVLDLISSSYIESADVSQYRTINGTWTLVSNQETDLTGRSRFYYSAGVEYKFIFSKTGYTSKSIFLEPLFSSYTVRLESETTETADTNNYYTTITPNLFYDEETNNLTFTLSSSKGTLESYSINITAPNVSEHITGSNSYGEEFNFNLHISGADIGDSVKVEYAIKETGRATDYIIKKYNIVNALDTNGFFQWDDDASTGMGLFEKSLIATFLLLIISSIIAIGSSLIGINPLVPTGLGFILFLALFGVMGFVPIWSVYSGGLALFLIIIFSLRSA